MIVPEMIVEDTYAEAFRSVYAEVLITARDPTWLDRAVNAATGNASSTIMCDCEAGLDRYVDDTPDGRPGAVVQFHVPRFRKDHVERLERVLLVRISQNVLTCPTAACYSPFESDSFYKLGRKIAYFGNGFQFRAIRHGRPVWVIPTLSGEFVLDRRFGYRPGLMGGNLWFLARDFDTALAAAERAAEAIRAIPGVILPFPGGIVGSGSQTGSKYPFLIASTNHRYCPTLRGVAGVDSALPQGVNSVMEIIINGRDVEAVTAATYAAISATVDAPGLVRISAGNYGGRLGKTLIYLRKDKH
jgi:formylmethanofuran--tetrahydromethanopterin N-formyltransferase